MSSRCTSRNSEAQSSPKWFRGEEGFEYLCYVFFRYSRAGVLYVYADKILIQLRAQLYPVSFLRRIYGIQDQIQEGPFHLRNVDFNGNLLQQFRRDVNGAAT